VLVGHSYGGMLVRLFAHDHDDKVAGVVLVDAVHADQSVRALAIIQHTPAFARLRREVRQSVVQGVDFRAGEALDRRVRSLGNTRLVVITSAQTHWPDLPPRLRRSLDHDWDKMQTELTSLSTDSVHAVALRSDHFVQSFLTGQPDVVIRAVRAVVDADRGDRQLPSCEHIFRRLAVPCRR
jgi:pimeloyl-ACP methyl ester carboxylesterase